MDAITVRAALKSQIADAAGNVKYTYIAHWAIVNRLNTQNKVIKIAQIVLTALAAGGFLASLVVGIPQLSWLGGSTSALALALNLYMLNFDLPANIRQHAQAANDLWKIREAYTSLLVDFDDLSSDAIRRKRDELTIAVGEVNDSYPGTDGSAFRKAQKQLGRYAFEDGEAEELLHLATNGRDQMASSQ